jgi:signal peptidase I
VARGELLVDSAARLVSPALDGYNRFVLNEGHLDNNPTDDLSERSGKTGSDRFEKTHSLEGMGSSGTTSSDEVRDLSVTDLSGAVLNAEPASEPKRERSGIVESLVLVLIALVLALTLKTYVAEAYEIKGKSMRPTFLNGQRVVVLKSFYNIQRGDIIVFASREDPAKDLIKRVIGLPGEKVRIVRGQVFINGKKIEEGYARHNSRERGRAPKSETIPPGHYYVLGDNRPDSHDSRFFHSISEKSLKGKVVVRWWPLRDFSAF